MIPHRGTKSSVVLRPHTGKTSPLRNWLLGRGKGHRVLLILVKSKFGLARIMREEEDTEVPGN